MRKNVRKKNEGKKSTESQQNAIPFFKYKPNESFYKFSILAYRLQECILALAEYSDFPNQEDVTIFLNDELSQLQSEKKLKEYLKGGALPEPVRGHDKINDFSRSILNVICGAAEKIHVGREHQDIYNDIIKNCDIRDEQSLTKLSHACIILSIPRPIDITNEKNIKDVLSIEDLVMAKANEAIGYWTHKLEERKRNKKGGGYVVHGQGNRNKDAIRQVLVELKIKSLSVFRKDKSLRKSFYDKAAEITKEADLKHKMPLSEKRISDIAREILKEQSI